MAVGASTQTGMSQVFQGPGTDLLRGAQAVGHEGAFSAHVAGLDGARQREQQQGITVWADGVPSVAVVGPKGLEIRGSVAGQPSNPVLSLDGRHPFVGSPVPPPPPPPVRSSFLFWSTMSPTTPNGTRIPKEPLRVAGVGVPVRGSSWGVRSCAHTSSSFVAAWHVRN